MIKTEQLSSRTKHLKRTLTILKYENAYKALDLVIKEMCVDKGFSRHNGKHYYHHLVDVAQLLLNFGIKDEVTITDHITWLPRRCWRSWRNQLNWIWNNWNSKTCNKRKRCRL